MIDRIEFKNFKVLRDTTLPLGRFTLIVGPNGSGKSTALQAFDAIREPTKFNYPETVTAGVTEPVSILVSWSASIGIEWSNVCWEWNDAPQSRDSKSSYPSGTPSAKAVSELTRVTVFDFDPHALAKPVALVPNMELTPKGLGLAGVLDRLRDTTPERFEALNLELSRWLPEFNRILFHVPEQGKRSISLRTTSGSEIPANNLSHGTLLALAILTIAYLPTPPPVVAFEDPDRGLHPRLLRDVQEALYRLAYPENYGENRPPVQVIATTHSPYFLDLFKDHPEEIVIAQKQNGDAIFERLADRPDIDEILADAPLGEVWYSGILGGVPVAP